MLDVVKTAEKLMISGEVINYKYDPMNNTILEKS
jgi:hypothetical protein